MHTYTKLESWAVKSSTKADVCSSGGTVIIGLSGLNANWLEKLIKQPYEFNQRRKRRCFPLMRLGQHHQAALFMSCAGSVIVWKENLKRRKKKTQFAHIDLNKASSFLPGWFTISFHQQLLKVMQAQVSLFKKNVLIIKLKCHCVLFLFPFINIISNSRLASGEIILAIYYQNKTIELTGRLKWFIYGWNSEWGTPADYWFSFATTFMISASLCSRDLHLYLHNVHNLLPPCTPSCTHPSWTMTIPFTPAICHSWSD